MMQAEPIPYDFSASQIPSSMKEFLRRWQTKFVKLVDSFFTELSSSKTTSSVLPPASKSFSDLQNDWEGSTVGLRYRVSEQAFAGVLLASKESLLRFALTILGQNEEELPDRQLTHVEASLAKMIFEQIVEAYSRTWPLQQSLAIQLDGDEPNISQSKVYPRDTELLVLNVTSKHPGGDFPFAFVLPRSEVEELADLVPQDVVASGTALQLTSMSDIEVTLSATLGTLQMDMSELMSLSVGDVITFDQEIEQPVPVSVNGEVLFDGWPGRVGSQLGVKLRSVA